MDVMLVKFMRLALEQNDLINKAVVVSNKLAKQRDDAYAQTDRAIDIASKWRDHATKLQAELDRVRDSARSV